MLLFFLKVFLDRALHPYDASQEDEGERRQDNQVVGNVAKAVQDVYAEQRAAAQELPEEGHHNEDESVAGAVGCAVKEAGPGLVAQGESLDSAHHDTVCDDEADIDGQLLVNGVGGFEAL